jgi:peroxiredoxin
MLFSSPSPVDDVPPTADALAKAASYSVQDADGKEHTLSSLLSTQERTLVIFVRHHHCGFCVEYVRACGKDERLKATTTTEKAKTKVIVIGHGSYEGINRYKEVSESPFEMYVDSEKNVYTALGLTRRTLGKSEGAKEVSMQRWYNQSQVSNAHVKRILQPSYFNGLSAVSLVAKSISEAVGSGMLAFKGGEISLLGGEFLFEGGESIGSVLRGRGGEWG